MKDDHHIIWSNHNLDFEDWRDDLEEQYPGLPESELDTTYMQTSLPFVCI